MRYPKKLVDTGLHDLSQEMMARLALFALLAVGLAACKSAPPVTGSSATSKANDYLSVEHLRRKLEMTELATSVRPVYVKSARLTIGEVAALRLEACYMGGFPTEGKTTYMPDGDTLEDYPKSMSRRERAECQAVIDAVHKNMARFEAEERKKDAAYDRAHPVK
jgi:hypothetical protein